MRTAKLQARVCEIKVSQEGPVILLDENHLAQILHRPSSYRGFSFIVTTDLLQHIQHKGFALTLQRMLQTSRHHDWGFIFMSTDSEPIPDRSIMEYIEARRIVEKDTLSDRRRYENETPNQASRHQEHQEPMGDKP